MDFGYALKSIKEHKPLSRKVWKNANIAVYLQEPLQGSKFNMPFLFMCTGKENKVPWLPNQADLLALDWFIVGEEEALLI